MGFTYTIDYKKVIDNTAVDALSRRDEGTSIAQLTVLQPMWISEVVASHDGDDFAQEAIVECTVRPHDVSYFQYMAGLLKFKGKMYVGSATNLREQIITYFHESNLGGHSGILGTYQRVQLVFLWPHFKQQVKDMVSKCSVCQITNPEHAKTPGLLQPLPIPEQAWACISMDFIEQLPKSKGQGDDLGQWWIA